ncbi:MAG: LPS translocon maturation chaperone LptM [Bordetella sp.]|uniref:LPS translocon maturation chaperone LptM n=1 Tax=Bordetella sp. TaxID=28081 RepID=UPI003F7C0A2B
MLAACGVLAACGYKGPLYLPGSPQDHHRPVPPPALKQEGVAAPGNSVPDGTRPAQPVPDLFQQ